MYLRLNPEEVSIKDIFDSFFESECSIERVRSAEETGFDADTWVRFVETGGPGMCLPEKCGGGGADLSTAAIVADLLGAYVAPIPFIEHVVATRLLASLDASNADLTQLAAGERARSHALPSSIQLAKRAEHRGPASRQCGHEVYAMRGFCAACRAVTF